MSLELLFSCSNDDESVKTSDISVQFDNRVSSTQDLELNTSTFMTTSNEMISVSELKYIISKA